MTRELPEWFYPGPSGGWTADMLGHVLLFARANGIDLAAAVERKWRFRPG